MSLIYSMLMSVDGYVEDEHGTPSQWIVVLFEIRSLGFMHSCEPRMRNTSAVGLV
jgi:hypothetical protein